MLEHTTAQFDEVLTKRAVALLEDRTDFAVANGAIPMIATTAYNGNYKVWKAADFRRRNVEKRANGTEFKRVNLGVEEKGFSCEEEGYEIPVADRNRLEGEMEDTTAKMVEDAYAQFDIRLADKLNATFIPNAKTGTENGTGDNEFVKWSANGSNPIADIKKYKAEIKKALGVNPDSLLISEDVYVALTENATILARLRTDADKEITAAKLAQFFGLDNVYVLAGGATVSADGQDAEFGGIGTNVALLYYRGKVDGATNPSAIKCFYNTQTYGEGTKGIIIQTYRDERITADVARVVQDFVIVVAMADGAILLTDVIG